MKFATQSKLFAQQFVQTLRHFPWRNTAWAMRQRFREDHLGLTASSLTFTTTLALVPLITVALAVFTAFPIFGKLQTVLQKWLVESLVPDNIARQVLGYLTQFASQANKLGAVGLFGVVVSALLLILTIDYTLNAIWRVKRLRPIAQRVLIYWAVLTLGPLLLGASLTATSYLMTASGGLVGGVGRGVSGQLRFFLGFLEFAALSAGSAALFHYVPNAPVRSAVPTYSVVYGAFATVPILLLWIYVVWVIVLLGAVLAAYLPSLLSGVARRGDTPGWQFQLAIELMQTLQAKSALRRAGDPAGIAVEDLAPRLRVDAIQLAPVLEQLRQLDWVGLIEVTEEQPVPRAILITDPSQTPLAPLVQRLLLPDDAALTNLWENARLRAMRLSDVL
jgi:membrane protein